MYPPSRFPRTAPPGLHQGIQGRWIPPCDRGEHCLSPSFPPRHPSFSLPETSQPSSPPEVEDPGLRENHTARQERGDGRGGSQGGEFTDSEVCSRGEPYESNDRSAGGGWGRRGSLENRSLLSQGLRGNPGAGTVGLSGRSPPPRPRACPPPPPPPAAAPAPHGRQRRAPPRSPALSRVLCRPFQGEGKGARRELLQWIAEAGRQSVESHRHIKMPY